MGGLRGKKFQNEEKDRSVGLHETGKGARGANLVRSKKTSSRGKKIRLK